MADFLKRCKTKKEKETKVVEASTQKIMWDGSILIMEASVPEHIRLTFHREYEHVFSSLSHLPL